jgi:hypothetical protein
MTLKSTPNRPMWIVRPSLSMRRSSRYLAYRSASTRRGYPAISCARAVRGRGY